MLENNIKIAWRNIKKYPGYSIQNILSLSIAFATAILAIVYMTSEFSFDKHYDHSERIFRLNTDLRIGDQEIHTAESSDAFGPLLAESFVEIESYVRFFNVDEPFVIRKGDKFLKETKAVFVDSSLFAVFNIPMVERASTNAFSEPNTVIITKTIANKYFGDKNAVGRTLELEELSNSTQRDGSYKVVAVIEDFSTKAHFEFDFLFPIANLEYGWNNYAGSNFNTYFLLKEGADYHSINQRIKDVVQSRIYPIVSHQLGINQNWGSFIEKGNQMDYSLFPMTNIHLYSNREGELGLNGTIQTVYILISLSLFVLLMASVNYVNLATSRAIGRTREVGVRKVLGSSRGSLVIQFLTESIVLVMISTIIAFFVALLMLPVFNVYLSTSILSADLFQRSVLLYILLLVGSIGMLSGAYPAFFLSSFKTTNAIKGGGTHLMGGVLLRKYLIVAQLTISIALIIGTFTVSKQLEHLQKVDVGYNKEHVLIVSNVNDLGGSRKAFRDELSNTPGIISAALTGVVPVNSSRIMGSYSKESDLSASSTIPIRTWWVDEYFLETLDIPILEGYDFSRIPAENNRKIIINEEAVKVLGLEDPIGKKIYTEGNLNFIVAGVVRDFNYESLRQKAGPILLLHSDGSREQHIAIRFSAEADYFTMLSGINSAWESFYPAQSMDYYFLDEAFNSVYRHDQLISKIGLAVSLLAVTIACMGLLGLISFTTERRRKEIGVRKVFGASVYNILTMFSKDFTVLVIISWSISCPIAWWAMNKWLQDFAYRINIEWEVFALAGGLAITLALATVSLQSIKAAIANPVDSIRDA